MSVRVGVLRRTRGRGRLGRDGSFDSYFRDHRTMTRLFRNSFTEDGQHYHVGQGIIGLKKEISIGADNGSPHKITDNGTSRTQDN